MLLSSFFPLFFPYHRTVYHYFLTLGGIGFPDRLLIACFATSLLNIIKLSLKEKSVCWRLLSHVVIPPTFEPTQLYRDESNSERRVTTFCVRKPAFNWKIQIIQELMSISKRFAFDIPGLVHNFLPLLAFCF